MATKAITISECDGCGRTKQEDGAKAGFPPVEWAHLTLIIRHEGDGWTNSTRVIQAETVCPECTGLMAAAFGRLRTPPLS